ncbi:MAG: RagB/SusD family nutrient uptake outer membrane protein [Bacteroidota bacterium]
MRRFLSITLCAGLLFSVAACDSYVEDVDLPIDDIDDSLLDDETQIPFVIQGVQARFSDVVDFMSVLAAGLSDEFIFDQNVPNSTFPSFDEIDYCRVEFANNTVDGGYEFVNELRFFADDLLRRTEGLTFEDATLQDETLFTGNFYGAVGRYYLATYFALTPDQPGGVITDNQDEPGPFLSSSELYSQALAKLDAAASTATADQAKLINFMRARIHLFQGDFAAAEAAAAASYVEGDAGFTVPYATEDANYFWSQAGRGRSQFVANFRFNDYLTENPDEVARIPLDPITGNDDTTIYYRQGLYTERTSSIEFGTWQEVALIRAELAWRDGNNATALQLVNQVRASHGLAALDTIDQDLLLEERDKELFTAGTRIVDMRRFNLPVEEACTGPWRHFPLTQSERNGNTNF